MGMAAWAYKKNHRLLIATIDSLYGAGHSEQEWEKSEHKRLKEELPNKADRDKRIAMNKKLNAFWR